MRILTAILFFVLTFSTALPAEDSCYECHLDLKGKLQKPATVWQSDVHLKRGLLCTACHGGDASVNELSASKSTNDFLGFFEREDVPQLCARCHDDAARMQKYTPEAPVNQVAEFSAGVHGKRLAAGDLNAPNCVDCHDIHQIREVSEPASQVHPLRLGETCAQCHAKAAGFYEASSHKALLGQGESGNCVICHGTHEIGEASPALLVGSDSTCTSCHEEGSEGAKAAGEMARLITELGDALDLSERILAQASEQELDVSQAQARLKAGREAQAQARAAVHTFGVEDVSAYTKEGLDIAAETYRAGEDALKTRKTQ